MQLNLSRFTGMTVKELVYSLRWFCLEERPGAKKLQDLVGRKDISVKKFLACLSY